MSSPAAITLLLPCYNAAPFLPEIMRQAQGQTRPFAAILGYDDGSSDDTAAVAAALGLALIGSPSNQGPAAARNRLASAANSPWIHFHDVDDLIDPQFVERMSAACTDEVDVVTCDADWLDGSTREVQQTWRYSPASLGNDPARHLLTIGMSLNNSVIRKSLWQKVGGCDERLRMWEDADVHIRLAFQGARWTHLPEVLSFAVRRPTSFSHDYRRSWLYRLTTLENYAGTAEPRFYPAIAAEAERAAGELIVRCEKAGARRALRLCRRLGVSPLASQSAVLRLLRFVLPELIVLRLQIARRKVAKTMKSKPSLAVAARSRDKPSS
jgi:glycosyltransferase involved in cell wall biosynthesis